MKPPAVPPARNAPMKLARSGKVPKTPTLWGLQHCDPCKLALLGGLRKLLKWNVFCVRVRRSISYYVDAVKLIGAGSGAPGLGSMKAIARSVIAVMVRLGFTPTLAGIADPSHTSRLW
jgi:hypothetical protein